MPTVALAAVAVAAAACTPALDWREVRPDGSGVATWFPCRVQTQTRSLPLGGRDVVLTLSACSAAGATWALSWADVGDAARLAPALRDLRAAPANALRDVRAEPPRPAAVRGAAPAGAVRLQWSGTAPDGRRLHWHRLVFAHGTHAVEASVVGERIDADAVDAFFGSLHVAR